MIRLTPTSKPEVILKFLNGAGIRRRCNAGRDVSLEKTAEALKSSKAIYVVAVEDDKRGLGFVMFNPEGPNTYSIHVCLRTIGQKTQKIFALAIQYAKFVLGAVALDAVFLESYKGCIRLMKNFGFLPMPSLKPHYEKCGFSGPMIYARLQLA